MITSAADYYFVQGDISQVLINGEIMPRRSGTAQKVLRGLDPCFLLEGCLERIGWWRSLQNRTNHPYSTYSNSWRTTANFSRKVRIANDNTGIGSVPSLLDSIYSRRNLTDSGQTVATFGFLSDLPQPSECEEPLLVDTTFEGVCTAQNILLSSYAFDGFDTTLSTTPVLQLYAAMNRAKYAYISLPYDVCYTTEPTTTIGSDTGNFWADHVNYYSDVNFSTLYGSFDWSEDSTTWDCSQEGAYIKSANFGIIGGGNFCNYAYCRIDPNSATAMVEPIFTSIYSSVPLRTFYLMRFRGCYSYGESIVNNVHTLKWGANGTGRHGSIDCKFLIQGNDSSLSGGAYLATNPSLTLAEMENYILGAGGEVYDVSSLTTQKGCDYSIIPTQTILILPFPRTSY